MRILKCAVFCLCLGLRGYFEQAGRVAGGLKASPKVCVAGICERITEGVDGAILSLSEMDTCEGKVVELFRPFNIPVYGFKIVRELFRVFDYRSNSWVTSGTSSAPAYQKLETCVKDRIETKYKLNKSVEQYETIAELAAVHMLYEMYVDTVQRNRGDYADIRLPFLRSVPSTTQFFVALASELCARVNGTTAALLNEEYGRKTAEQRLNIIATFMPQFTEHFKCGHKSRMRTEKTYRDCLFWR
ncbi:uncharacterized protein LOC144167421 isoform X1 [Haemaphysalis longicornis]